MWGTFAEKLWNDLNSSVCQRLPIETSIALLVYYFLSCQTYTNQRKIVKSAGFGIYPHW